jgi:predicted aspartyl protease
MQEFKAFTRGFPGRTNLLSSSVEISKATKTGERVSIFPAMAMWDTGANCCCITKTVAKELGLSAVRKVSVLTAAGYIVENIYEVCFHLPNDVAINLEATEISEVSGGMDALIGMNIIGLGDFAISNFEGRTHMTFRVPSVADADYT